MIPSGGGGGGRGLRARRARRAMFPRMSSGPALPSVSRPIEVQRCVALAAIGAWTAIVPYLGSALGLKVDVAARVEVVDHVIPGLLVVVAGLYLSRIARRGELRRERFALPLAGVCFLAGFWVLATHVPLLGDAAQSDQAWDAAIWHSISALPILILAVWGVLRSIPERMSRARAMPPRLLAGRAARARRRARARARRWACTASGRSGAARPTCPSTPGRRDPRRHRRQQLPARSRAAPSGRTCSRSSTASTAPTTRARCRSRATTARAGRASTVPIARGEGSQVLRAGCDVRLRRHAVRVLRDAARQRQRAARAVDDALGRRRAHAVGRPAGVRPAGLPGAPRPSTPSSRGGCT